MLYIKQKKLPQIFFLLKLIIFLNSKFEQGFKLTPTFIWCKIIPLNVIDPSAKQKSLFI